MYYIHSNNVIRVLWKLYKKKWNYNLQFARLKVVDSKLRGKDPPFLHAGGKCFSCFLSQISGKVGLISSKLEDEDNFTVDESRDDKERKELALLLFSKWDARDRSLKEQDGKSKGEFRKESVCCKITALAFAIPVKDWTRRIIECEVSSEARTVSLR